MYASLLQRIDLSPFDQKGCNDLLKRKGFFKKLDASTEVPLDFIFGPYVERELEGDQEPEVAEQIRQEL